MSGYRLERLVERLQIYPDLKGFSFSVEGENIRIAGPDGSQLFDFDDARFLLEGLGHKIELDAVDRINKVRFGPLVEFLMGVNQPPEPEPEPLPRVKHPVLAAAQTILEAQGWRVSPVSQELFEITGLLLDARRKSGVTRLFQCPECGADLDRKKDGAHQFPFDWEALEQVSYMWGCPNCEAIGTAGDLPEVPRYDYRAFNVEQCEDLVKSRAYLPVNEHAHTPQQRRRYGEVALESALAEVAALAGQSGRNNQLNRIAFSMGRLIEPCGLSYEEVRGRLIDAALSIGLKQTEMATVDSGLKGGMKAPKEF